MSSSKKSLIERQVEALELIAKSQRTLFFSQSLGKTLQLPLEDDRDKDEWGYPRRYSESGW